MTAWAESKRFKRMMQRRIVFYLFLTMLSLSIVLPSFARKKQKKTKAVAVENNSTPLSYNDQRRFDYFFLEAVRQQNQGNLQQHSICTAIVRKSTPMLLCPTTSWPVIN